MPEHFLVVSNPPHREIDVGRAAAVFGLSAAEVRMKANYPLPEIWVSGTDEARVRETGDALVDAGLRVVVIPGRELEAVGSRQAAAAHEFRDDGLWVSVAGVGKTIPFDSRLLGVLGRPEGPGGSVSRSTRRDSAFSRLSHAGLTPDTLVGRSSRGAPESGRSGGDDDDFRGFLDLYDAHNHHVARVSFIEGVSPGDDWVQGVTGLADEIAARFSRARVDRRLVGVRARRRLRVGAPPPDERRKGYSFASRALDSLLASMAPNLRHVTQSDLESRLIYLTQSAG